jgi:hypothetical protein
MRLELCQRACTATTVTREATVRGKPSSPIGSRAASTQAIELRLRWTAPRPSTEEARFMPGFYVGAQQIRHLQLREDHITSKRIEEGLRRGLAATRDLRGLARRTYSSFVC